MTFSKHPPEVLIPIGNGLGAVRFHIELEGDPLQVDLALTRDPESMEPPVLVGVEIWAEGKGTIRATQFRIPVAQYARVAAETLMGPMPTLEPVVFSRATPEALSAVLHTYAVARMYGKSPAKAVQERFGFSSATATRWIARARQEQEI